MSSDNSTEAALDTLYRERALYEVERPKIEEAGIAALRRLYDVAQRDTGQSRVIARFLLGCYNGDRFPFDLTDFRIIDRALFDDCMAVLKMDRQPQQEVHCYFEQGGKNFEKMAKDWGLADLWRDKIELNEYRERYGKN
ncbi:MAG: hypothetical protein Q4G70_14525 [Pseudomonadota bacterium]|nr:hypothetical protein [Pseudomonadota bacterium]